MRRAPSPSLSARPRKKSTGTTTYPTGHSLDRNVALKRLCTSRECQCGAFARQGELDEIAFWYPRTAARIHAPEVRAAAVGVPCQWGRPPPEGHPAGPTPAVGLCWSCAAKKDAEDEPDVSSVLESSPPPGTTPEMTKRLTIDVPLSLRRRMKTRYARVGLVIAGLVRELLDRRFPGGVRADARPETPLTSAPFPRGSPEFGSRDKE